MAAAAPLTPEQFQSLLIDAMSLDAARYRPERFSAAELAVVQTIGDGNGHRWTRIATCIQQQPLAAALIPAHVDGFYRLVAFAEWKHLAVISYPDMIWIGAYGRPAPLTMANLHLHLQTHLQMAQHTPALCFCYSEGETDASWHPHDIQLSSTHDAQAALDDVTRYLQSMPNVRHWRNVEPVSFDDSSHCTIRIYGKA